VLKLIPIQTLSILNQSHDSIDKVGKDLKGEGLSGVFEILFWHLCEGPEENHWKPQSG
jgi:hypothetical protein